MNTGIHDVWGVACLESTVYWISQPSDVIQAASMGTRPTYCWYITIKGMKNPRDIACSSLTSNIYVADCEGDCVWLVKNEIDTEKWLHGVGRPRALSVTPGDRILILSSNGRLFLYGSDRQHLTAVELPNDLQRPRHALELDENRFVVCCSVNTLSHKRMHRYLYRPYRREGPVVAEILQRYHRYNHSRQYVGKTYGRVKGRNPGHLNRPLHLACDDDGWIFVADTDNSRVLLIDRNLNLHRILMSTDDDGQIKPYRLCYVKESGRLLIACERQILVYRIR